MRETLDSESELLRTIKYSQNLFKMKLPRPNYDNLNFATMPAHQVKLHQPSITKNSRNTGLNMKMQSHNPVINNTSNMSGLKSNLPKITPTNNKGQVSSQAQLPNNSTDLHATEDYYDNDFENPENDPEAAAKNGSQKKPKSRSYSGRKEIEVRGGAKQ